MFGVDCRDQLPNADIFGTRLALKTRSAIVSPRPRTKTRIIFLRTFYFRGHNVNMPSELIIS